MTTELPGKALRSGLSPREALVVDLVSLGMSNKEIADEVGLSPNTVKTMLSRAMARNKVTDRAALVARALREEWIQ